MYATYFLIVFLAQKMGATTTIFTANDAEIDSVQSNINVWLQDSINNDALRIIKQSDNTSLTAVGNGWDNLCNENRLPVLESQETKEMYYDPIQEEFRSQYFPHWKSYLEWGSEQLNQDGDFEFADSGISGSFSNSYRLTKQNRIQKRQVTARFQLLYKSHTVGLGLYKLNADFRKDVENMMSLSKKGKHKSLDYHCQLLIKNYGTHFIHKADMGFAIVEEDTLSAAKLYSQFHTLNHENEVMAAGSDYFFSRVDNRKLPALYAGLVSHCRITVAGCINSSMTQNLPAKLLPHSSDPVMLAKYGKSLDKVMTAENFPEFPTEDVKHVQHHIHRAIQEYYTANTYPGCLNLESPNFNLWANKEDDSCEMEKILSHGFGGMYQTCDWLTGQSDPCYKERIPNILTGQYSCQYSYKPILLYSGLVIENEPDVSCHTSCNGVWFFRTCKLICDNDERKGKYEIYWCSSDVDNNETGTPKQVVLFGGMFSAKTVNLITGKKTCPPAFRDLVFAGGLHVCLNNDNKGAREHMVEMSHVSSSVEKNFTCPLSYLKRSVLVAGNVTVYFCVTSANNVDYENIILPHIITPPFMTSTDDDDDNEDGENKGSYKGNKKHGLTIELIIAIIFILLLIFAMICAVLYKFLFSKSKTAPISDDKYIDK